LQSQIKKSGFTVPTAIQSIAWPVALDRHNLIGIASTGSGKTAAFLFPAMVSGMIEQLKGTSVAHNLLCKLKLTLCVSACARTYDSEM
jgi:superfamily II DNA/RNA helicase